MNILDIIIILCSIPILISGYKKGLIRQIISIIGLRVGVWVASALADNVGSWIYPIFKGSENPEGLAYLGGFAIVLVAICLIFLIFGRLIEKIILIAIPDWINKGLGLCLAAINCVLLCCALYMVFMVLNKIYLFTDFKDAIFTDSTLFPIIESTTNAILPNILKIF